MRKSGAVVLWTVGLALWLGGSACGQLLINGAGSSFGYPIYSTWFYQFSKIDPSARFNYQSVGSGGGIRMLRDRTVDFGASDTPLTDSQLRAMPAPVLLFPSVMGAVVLMYNLPHLKGSLRLSGPMIADIYLGRITKWNDPAIAALNPATVLPAIAIHTIHRSDGSGTTYIFSDYLSKVSRHWSEQVGRGTALAWPLGLGGKGSEGVTGLVQQTAGALGYVELTYALSNHIPIAVIRNRAGNWIKASLEGVTAAAASGQMPADFRLSITDAPGARCYPISSFTWLLFYRRQKDRAQGQAIVRMLKWALTAGQRDAVALDYAPLPKNVADRELKALSEFSFPPAPRH